MARVWELQEAENKFREVMEEAVKHSPQIITKDGIKIVVVLSYDEYHKRILSEKKLSEFFGSSPLAEVDLDLTRDKSVIR
jgi:prevent-host-death family protein